MDVFNLKGPVGVGIDGLCLNTYPDANRDGIPRRLNLQTRAFARTIRLFRRTPLVWSGYFCGDFQLHGLARQIKFLHIVFFAMTARCVSFAAIGYLAGGAAIYVLAFWGEATVTASGIRRRVGCEVGGGGEWARGLASQEESGFAAGEFGS